MDSSSIRDGIIEALRLAASAEKQQRYAADVSIADVPAEVFCIWQDQYVPDSPCLKQQFDAHEVDALASYAATCSHIARQLPDHLCVPAFQARDEWQDLASAARETLAALGVRCDDAV